MSAAPKNSWKFQHEEGERIHLLSPTDALGLRIRAESGYTHVHMGTADGWLQINVARRKLDHAAKMAKLVEVV